MNPQLHLLLAFTLFGCASPHSLIPAGADVPVIKTDLHINLVIAHQCQVLALVSGAPGPAARRARALGGNLLALSSVAKTATQYAEPIYAIRGGRALYCTKETVQTLREMMAKAEQ